MSKQIILDLIPVMGKLSLLGTVSWLVLLCPWWHPYHFHQGFQPEIALRLSFVGASLSAHHPKNCQEHLPNHSLI